MTKFRSTMRLAIILALGLSGCGGGGSSSDTPPTSSDTLPTTAKVEITSAVYNDNGTVPMDDDTITVYFSEEIDESSLPLDIESAFLVEGSGKIGTTTVRNYTKGWPYKLSIQLDNTAVSGDENTKISIADNVIKAANSGYYIEKSTPRNWEASHTIFLTGQNQSYNEGGEEVYDDSVKDDGYYKNGIEPKLTDNGDGTVTDEINGLIWQNNDELSLEKKKWMTDTNFDLINSANEDTLYNTSGDTAATYCTDLEMASYNDWRLPTKEELSSITVKSKINPAINDIVFKYTEVDNDYWTITPCGECPELAWKISFYDGSSSSLNSKKNIEHCVRCVRYNR